MNNLPIGDGGLLDSDIVEIINTKQFPKRAVYYKCIIHTPDIDIPIKDMSLLEFYNDYVNDIGEYIVASFKLPIGYYMEDVVPYMDNLEFTISMEYYNITVNTKYKLVILNSSKTSSNTMLSGMSKEQLNNLGFYNVQAQAVDRLVEILRTDITQGIYTKTNVKSVMLASIKEKLDGIKVEGKTIPTAIDIAEPDNKEVYNEIVIPFGVNILDLPTFLQNSSYGVYNNGIGTYLKSTHKYTGNPKDVLHIYDLFDNTRFDKEKGTKLIVLSSNTKTYELSETTYTLDDNILKIISSDTVSKDDGEISMIDKGNTIVRLNTNKVIQGKKNVTNETVRLDPNRHMIKQSNYNKRDSVNKPIYIENDINNYTTRSEITAKRKKIYKFQWKYSNQELLTPGMPVSVVYYDKVKGIVTLKGRLIYHYGRYDFDYDMTTTILTVMVDSPVFGDFINEKDKKIVLNKRK